MGVIIFGILAVIFMVAVMAISAWFEEQNNNINNNE
jgi:flagellar basal body-associated protein FliL